MLELLSIALILEFNFVSLYTLNRRIHGRTPVNTANPLSNSESRDSITENKLEDKCEKDFEITPSIVRCTVGETVADGLISSPPSDIVNCLVLIYDREKGYTTVAHFNTRST